MNIASDPKYFNNYYYYHRSSCSARQPYQSGPVGYGGHQQPGFDPYRAHARSNEQRYQTEGNMQRSRGPNYYPGSEYGHGYSTYGQQGQGYGHSTASYGQVSGPGAQHNHPPYYPNTGSAYAHESGQHYEQSYPNGYPPGQSHISASGASTSRYGQEMSSGYAGGPAATSSGYPYQDQAQSYQQTASGMANSTTPKSTYPPASLNLKPSTTAKNPYGQTGPYGIDAANPYIDYYRKLYYPYDPITGEYMKDATPPGETSTSLLPQAPGISSTSDHPPMSSQLPRQHAHSISNRYPAGRTGMEASGMLVSSNYYGQDSNDSLLLCCDFLMPRPSINCLIITLLAILVLIIIFTVVKFTIIYPNDSSSLETLALVDQIVVLLLIAAFIALIWIFGLYFTSRRTRRQVASLLSCATMPMHNANAVDTSLVPVSEYANGYGTVYANANAASQHQHYHHAHHHSSRGPQSSQGTYANYRYANTNFV